MFDNYICISFSDKIKTEDLTKMLQLDLYTIVDIS